MSDNECESKGDSGALKTSNVQTGHLKKGSHVMIKGRPCKVDCITTSKPGKHGSAKCHIVGIDIFTGKKMEEISPSHANMAAPIVKRKEYQVHDVDDCGFLCLWDDEESCSIDHVRLGEDDCSSKIKEMQKESIPMTVTILTAMGEEKVIEVKEDNKN